MISTQNIQNVFGINIPDWTVDVEIVLKQVIS